jgi:hypothetical protein
LSIELQTTTDGDAYDARNPDSPSQCAPKTC